MAAHPLLLALPLKNGIIKASDSNLDTASSIFEWAALFFGAWIFVGVCAEVWLAWNAFPDTGVVGHWGPVFADFIVAAGVGGEIWFAFRASRCQGELTRRAKKQLAEAIDRAARAEEQLLPRSLTEAQFNELQSLKGKIAVIWMTTPSDFEASRFAAQISLALQHAGISVQVAAQRIGLIWSELYIVIPERVADFRNVPLYVAFSKARFSVGCGDRSQVPMGDIPADVPVIMVGIKRPLAGDAPSFMAGLANPKSENTK